MKVETVSHWKDGGWSGPFPDLDSARTLVVMFGATSYLDDPAAVAACSAAYPRSTVIGCSTSGEIHGAELEDESLAVAVVRFEHTDLRSAMAPVTSTSSRSAGEELGRALVGDGLRGILVLSEGIAVNGSALTDGIRSVLPPDVIVTGGLAGDGDRFERTWVVHEGAPASGYASAVGFYGPRVQIGFGSKGGWDLFGPERVVTKSRENVLYELDGKPALALYKSYLGHRAAELPASGLLFPLALRENEQSGHQIVRTILGVSDSEESLTFAGDVPEGWLAQLMMANFDRLVDGAHGAAGMTRERTGAGPVLSIAISCVGRRLVLGPRTEEEIEAVIEALPPGARQVGFYSYGEISPVGALGCGLHNQTMTLTTLAED